MTLALALPSFRHQAACDPDTAEMFYPEPGSRKRVAPIQEDAKALCRRCPVVGACLTWALERDEPEGVWGGTTPEERQAIKERRRAS